MPAILAQPGVGNFVVRIGTEETPIVELLGMQNPFLQLQELDMEDVKSKVMKAIES